MENTGIIGTILAIFLVVMAILALFMPLFIMQIRDRVKTIERHLAVIVKNMVSAMTVTCPDCKGNFTISTKEGPKRVSCPHCGRETDRSVLRLL